MATATISVSRSAHKEHVPVVTSWKHGQIVPLFARQLDPGTTMKIDLTSLVRANTPVAPFHGAIECEINAFWMPMRLVSSKWKAIWGENENAAGIPVETEIVLRNSHDCDIFALGVPWDSLSAYLRKPIVPEDGSKHCNLTVFKEKMYYKVWSEHYRATMLQNPFIMSNNDDDIGSLNGVNLHTTSKLLTVNKASDYFTESLLSPQYGAGVQLPLGQYAPLSVRNSDGTDAETFFAEAVKGSGDFLSLIDDEASEKVVYADLSSATSASIIQLRYACALQRYQELGVYGGSLYSGQLLAHYGVTPADKSLQRTERIGTINFTLNVSQVTAMANTTVNGVSQPAGTAAAISVTGNSRQLTIKGADEHGIIMILLHTRIKNNIYTQGVLREDTRTKRTDWFANEFATVGDMKVLKKEIFVTGDSSDDEVFGYQSNNADINFPYAYVTGVCNPNAGSSVAVDVWSLATKFASRPELNGSFLVEDRKAVASRLITGTSSNYDYTGEFDISLEIISEVPVNPLPGRLDHVGLF